LLGVLAGFIGSHFARALVRAGHVARVLDKLSTGSLENLDGALNSVELVVGDIKSYGVVEKAVREADAHLATFYRCC